MGVVNLLEFGKKNKKKTAIQSNGKFATQLICLHLGVVMYPDETLSKCSRLCAGACCWKATFSIAAVKLFWKMTSLMRQRNSPGRIGQIKVNGISEIASCRSAVNSWVLHVQVERLAVRLGKSEQQHGDTKERAGEKGCYPRRLYAKSSRTHFLFFF